MEDYFEIQPSDSINEILSKMIINIFEDSPSQQMKFD